MVLMSHYVTSENLGETLYHLGYQYRFCTSRTLGKTTFVQHYLSTLSALFSTLSVSTHQFTRFVRVIYLCINTLTISALKVHFFCTFLGSQGS